MSNSPHSPLPKHALSYSKVVKKFSPNSYSSEDTMDRIIAKKTDEPEDDDTDSTESAVIKERLLKQRQLNKQKKEIVIDDSSVESLTSRILKIHLRALSTQSDMYFLHKISIYVHTRSIMRYYFIDRIHASCSQIHPGCISASVSTHSVISILQNHVSLIQHKLVF